jgi:integrase/recombinase XerD
MQSTRKRAAFSANTLCQTLNAIYRRAVLMALPPIQAGVASSLPWRARVLASLAGHRSIATTQCYIDVNDEMKRQAVELVG